MWGRLVIIRVGVNGEVILHLVRAFARCNDHISSQKVVINSHSIDSPDTLAVFGRYIGKESEALITENMFEFEEWLG